MSVTLPAPTEAPNLALEGTNLANAVFASLTPHMVMRFGEVAESAATALDVLTAPEILSLLRRTQELAPLLEQGLSVLAAMAGPDDGDSAARVAAAAREAAAHARASSRPVGLRDLLALRREPAVQHAMRFLVALMRNLRPA
jgi:uncharacterized protein YjgD (DUF1641 family)